MSAYLFEWASLLGRWLHVITGIAWIGASFYFVWLDNHLLPPQRRELVDAGVGGEVWAVHGGGFYNAQKYKTAPIELPQSLHWFYWEAYWTWLSGFFLLCLIYFGKADVYLIDASVAKLSVPGAIGITLATLSIGWVIYDVLCRSLLARNGRMLGVAIALLLCIAAYGLCHVFSGRGAYIVFGALLGTIMVANVFFVIIPGQREMVSAKQQAREFDPIYALRGKQRSVHNTYFTLPVLFVMLSNHYALTYASALNWLVLVAISAAGASIRVWFVARHRAHERGGTTSPLPLVCGVSVLIAVGVALAPKAEQIGIPNDGSPAQRFAHVQTIVQQRCVPCHATAPTFAGLSAPPKGVLLDSADHILTRTAQMQQQLSSRLMPLGNLTQMSEAERDILLRWLSDGAPH